MKTKNKHAVALGKLGGKAALTKMTKKQRIERATKASHARHGLSTPKDLHSDKEKDTIITGL